MTIVAEIRGGSIREEISHHYPTLPVDAVRAVRRWATENGISLDPEAGGKRRYPDIKPKRK
jgi:uncharacterized protein (DUF433 family)